MLETRTRTIYLPGVTEVPGAQMIDDVPCLKIPEADIKEFCRGCDKFLSNNLCELIGSDNQGLTVRRGLCTWASVNRIKGRMTDRGFIVGRNRRSVLESDPD